MANERYMGSAVLAEVLRERQRQIEVEGWTAEHDDDHNDGELAQAAASYAYPVFLTFNKDGKPVRNLEPVTWPEDWNGWWKPKDRRRDLIRAAALIVAELERLDRLAGKG